MYLCMHRLSNQEYLQVIRTFAKGERDFLGVR